MSRLYFKQFIFLTSGLKYFAVNAIRSVLTVCHILRKMQTGLQNLPNVLVPNLPRYFVKFTITYFYCVDQLFTKKYALNA